MCPSCEKNAVPTVYGLINVFMLLFSGSIKCRSCKIALKLIKGTKRLLIVCALVGWLFGILFASVQPGLGAILFFLFISIPALMNRRFFETY